MARPYPSKRHAVPHHRAGGCCRASRDSIREPAVLRTVAPAVKPSGDRTMDLIRPSKANAVSTQLGASGVEVIFRSSAALTRLPIECMVASYVRQ